MAAVNNQLVLVGGKNISTNKRTNTVGVWKEGSQTWIHPFPVMPTLRCLSSSISHRGWLIVVGGTDQTGSYLNKVEIMDTNSKQWYESSPLPNQYSEMSSTINGNMWYLSGGFCAQGPNRCVLSVCLDDLIAQAFPQSTRAASKSTQSPWKALPDLPLNYSTVLIYNGALFSVGGSNTSAIYLYQPSKKNWIRVSNLPTKRWQCACTILPSGEIFVTGGEGVNKCMNIATIL